MKAAFDEHVPAAFVRTFEILENDRQFKHVVGDLRIERARNFAPKPNDPDFLRKNDVPWIKRFSAAGGKVIISGDTSMMSKPHERLALVQTGMITFFFGSQWSNWRFHKQVSLLLYYFPQIAEIVKKAQPGTCWRIPSHWRDDGEIAQLSNEDRKLIKIDRQKADGPRKRAARAKRAAQLAQGQFDFGGAAINDRHEAKPIS